jgi:hypothetical protein
LYAIPNGGKRGIKEAARLKAGGVAAGMPDICIPKPLNGFGALYVELKSDVPRGTVSKHQKEKLKLLNSAGNFACVAYGYDECVLAIDSYWSGDIAAIEHLRVKYLDVNSN